MILTDTDIISRTSTGTLLISDRVPIPDLYGIVVYDKFSNDPGLVDSSQEVEPDYEDYVVWKFVSGKSVFGVTETVSIHAPLDYNKSLHGKSFKLSTLNADYTVTYNVSTGTPALPSPTPTDIYVNIVENSTQSYISNALAAALDNSPEMRATSDGSVVKLVHEVYKDIPEPSDVDSGTYFHVIREGGEEASVVPISNNSLYPKLRPKMEDYSRFNLMNFNIITEFEWKIIDSVLKRIDTVRRRYPNQGERVLGMGFSGGFEKKFSVEEVLDYLYITAVEVNLHPPATNQWFQFTDKKKLQKRFNNPFGSVSGIPYQWYDLLVLGTTIKALVARQLYEIDTNFQLSDNGISITYERDSKLGSMVQGMMEEYDKKKTKLKWQYAPHGGSGLGTFYGFGGHPIYASVLNSMSFNGIVGLRSLSPYFAGGRTS